MKHNNFENVDKIQTTNLANLFNVYQNKDLGNFSLTYAINRTFNIVGLENINRKYYNNYIVKNNDTWLSISYDAYGVNRLWWLVCKMNNIKDPTVDPVEGTQLILLKEQFVEDILNALELK